MSASAPSPPSPAAYQPGLAWAAATGGVWVFVLVMLGAFTTSIDAGMVFPDWPLSNGSINPEGWLRDLAMFAEHSHRLSAAVMAGITVAVALAVWRLERRRWLRRLAAGAVALVFVQALVGGLRVLFDHLHVPMVDTSVGRLFAMLHAGLAQIYICALIAIALGLSRAWIAPATPVPGERVRRLGVWCCALLLVQLAVAAVMRHSFAGLAIPHFPWSTAAGGLLPEAWNFRVGIHFAHRALALVLAAALTACAVAVWRDRAAAALHRGLAALMLVLLVVQIALGAAVIWTHRQPSLTTAHVLVGAATLAATFALTWLCHRDHLEVPARATAA